MTENPPPPTPSRAPREAEPKQSEAPKTGAKARAARTGAHEDFVEYVSSGALFRGLYTSWAYVLLHPGVLGLLFLETACWILGTAFCLLLLFHAEEVLQLQGQEALQFFGRALGCVGIALLGSALGMSRFSRKVSPILTYTPAFILISCGLFGVFHSAPEMVRTPVNGVMQDLPHASTWIYLSLFALGLGGGLLLGRLDADLRAMVDSEVRWPLRFLRALLAAALVLLTLMTFTESRLEHAQIQALTQWIPLLLLFSLPLVFVVSWIVDISIYTRKEVEEIREFPGPLHRFGYRALRVLARVLLKGFFRYEPIDARNVPETGGVVIAANHASFLDPLLLGCGTGRTIQFVMYSSYYRSFAHPLFRFLRCIPMDEKDQLSALKTGIRSLKLGACIGIFPEGSVSADGKLHPPMRGALFLAQRAGVPVVPAALKGNFQALPRGAWIPRPAKVTPIFGKPFGVGKDLSKQALEELTDRMMAGLARKLELEEPPKLAGQEQEMRISLKPEAVKP